MLGYSGRVEEKREEEVKFDRRVDFSLSSSRGKLVKVNYGYTR